MVPLAERIRPRRLAEVVSQDALLGAGGVLTRLLAAGRLPSLLLWGPPGCGKTTIARLLAAEAGLRFASLSAVLGGVAELRALVAEADAVRALGQGTLLFIDELHRFSKAQQDALLPHVESGLVTLVGATTENPSTALVRALLSRCRAFALAPLDEAGLSAVLDRALAHPEGLPGTVLDAPARALLLRRCAGDARRLLTMLESAAALGSPVGAAAVEAVAQAAAGDHDRGGDSHYEVASAFIKSMRASDAQAALFWLARQLEAGEDPAFVARRVVIFASEDVGLADPQALVVAMAALGACEKLGMPEAIYPLTQAVLYNATAPKSNRTKAYFAAAAAVREHPGAQVPLPLRNPVAGRTQDPATGVGYVYDPDAPDHFSGQDCLPEALRGAVFYAPGEFGFEKEIAKRMAWWDRLRRERRG